MMDDKKMGRRLPSIVIEGEPMQDPDSYNHVVFTAVIGTGGNTVTSMLRMSVVDVDKLGAVVGLEAADER